MDEFTGDHHQGEGEQDFAVRWGRGVGGEGSGVGSGPAGPGRAGPDAPGSGGAGTDEAGAVRGRWDRIIDELWQQDLAASRRSCGSDASADEVTRAAMAMRTPAQRSADAFVEMATRAATAPADGQRPRPLLSVVVSADELFGPIREMFNGLVLSRLEVAQKLFEADFERIVLGPVGQPVDVSSPQRFFTGGWRRAVEVRDRVCQHPTCDVTAEYCQVDHIVEHADGGQTSVDNGRLLCPKHNRQRPGRRQPPPAGRRTERTGGGSAGRSTGRGHEGGDGDPDQPV